ncbi:TM2 domain-containing protein [Roseicyclus marinus]|uniref:TM2 domain-containing protein n=1 Tax=Roseicyclus marinus TaxID=2161673 RepID=UPI002410310F|nr:TM2 domain-containing protein [Roseicyclus marinus]MDG3039675.1 TM2 domain-containing protein [Roseicyclus marinus]
MSLTTEQQLLIEQRVANDGKSTLVAYLIWFFAGFFGAHRFYLDKGNSGFLMLVFAVFACAALLGGTLLFLVVPSFVWVVIDFFLIPSMASQSRDELRTRLMRNADSDQ